MSKLISAKVKSLATSTASKEAVEAKQEKAVLTSEVKALVNHHVTFTKGRKFPIGTKAECFHVGISRRNSIYARVVVNGEWHFCDPANLSKGKPLSDARAALLSSEKEEKLAETVLIPGSTKEEREKALLIEYSEWKKAIWLPKSMVTILCDLEDGRTIYEVPKWKVLSARKNNPEAIEALLAEQDDLVAASEEIMKAKLAEKPVVKTNKYTGKAKK